MQNIRLKMQFNPPIMTAFPCVKRVCREIMYKVTVTGYAERSTYMVSWHQDTMPARQDKGKEDKDWNGDYYTVVLWRIKH